MSQKPNANPEPNGNQKPSPLISNAVCLLVSFDRLGIRRKLRDDQYEAGHAEKALTRAEKCILDSPEYKQIVAFEGHVKHYLASKALPSRLYRWSTYLIPVKALKDVDAFLVEAQKEWQERVDAFVAAYPKRKKETMKRLKEIASEADYKSEAEVRSSFSFTFEYVTMSTPTTLKQLSMAVFEREEKRMLERISTAEEEIVAAFRGKFAAAVDDMKAILTGVDGDGKAKRFHGWKIAKLREYIDEFKAEQNACGDKDLVAVMDEASKLLAGVDPKDLKKDEKWRESLAASFGDMGKKLAQMTAVRGKRQIDLDDEAA